ncbi:hypothetical protein EYF80_017907 [Liparis tanakae]|uniref:Uncharacterized protein n=1 Tax=Liparis tanakae TaxID=230148 RepID=A0A4Z2I235_9TELE|nr:hypothetical protein EYF80_017907 [Liparis tanakae]
MASHQASSLCCTTNLLPMKCGCTVRMRAVVQGGSYLGRASCSGHSSGASADPFCRCSFSNLCSASTRRSRVLRGDIDI